MGKRTKAIKKTDIKANKPWLEKVGFTSYKEESKEPNKTFLIVCEGQTEALYFEAFRTISAEVKSYDIGCSNNRLVDCTIDLAEESNYDEVWCVFDMDFQLGSNGQNEDFNSAIQKCINNNIKCAYSNDAFELWIYLHFQFTDQRNHRTFYFQQLSREFNINYEKEGKKRKFSSRLYDFLNSFGNANQSEAIERAKALENIHKGNAPHLQNPITFVHILVEELNKYI